ncbi:MAG: tRNA pseudouridine(55) synthase TruB [Lentisphaeria bacterium]|nr:tRNA pseudouridine(55) synthase TruB [Lentisphaeria bacterium]
MPECKACGILPVDKPATWTSFDVVNFVRSRFNVPKVGHCGTLDPAATGLLLLVLGKFTSLSGKLSGVDKQYTGTLTLGVETDSGDLDGKVIARSENLPGEEEIKAVFNSFKGRSMQMPPMFSAVKVGGKKLYELARQGVEVEREAREIEITRLDIDRIALPDVDFTVDCSKGTYIRTLCTDIGAKLGCGGILSALRRTRCGRFSINDSVTLDELKAMEQEEFTSMMAARLVKLSEGINL